MYARADDPNMEAGSLTKRLPQPLCVPSSRSLDASDVHYQETLSHVKWGRQGPSVSSMPTLLASIARSIRFGVALIEKDARFLQMTYRCSSIEDLRVL